MKPLEIKNMTIAEIEQSLMSLKEKLFELKAERVSGRLERPHRFKAIKRDIARCITIIKEKEQSEKNDKQPKKS